MFVYKSRVVIFLLVVIWQISEPYHLSTPSITIKPCVCKYDVFGYVVNMNIKKTYIKTLFITKKHRRQWIVNMIFSKSHQIQKMIGSFPSTKYLLFQIIRRSIHHKVDRRGNISDVYIVSCSRTPLGSFQGMYTAK